MMGTIRQIKPAAFPPPACHTTAHATAAASTSSTTNRNSTSSMSSKYSTNNANKIAAATTTTCNTKTTREKMKAAANPSSDATQSKQQAQHLHPNKSKNNNNTTLWQTLKAVAATLLPLLPLLAFLLLLSDSATPAQATPVFVDNPSLAQFQSGRNIRHLPCIVRKSGRSGVCMFAIDCIKQNGTHLGTCIDRFYFGSCCQLKDDSALFAPEISDNSIDQNTISHFPHESTTLPTSTLFKLTTTGPHHTVQSSSNSISETVRNVTQSYLQQNSHLHGTNGSSSSDKGDTTPIITTNSPKPVKLTTTAAPKRPQVQTTQKTSQFVVRTTAKPTVAPTTIKPPRRKTTVTRPVLTTTSSTQLATRVEVTTQPPKFFTFQIVETTTPSAAEGNIKLDDVPTTQRPVHTTNRYRPRPTTTEVPTQFVTTTLKPSDPVRFTTRPRPLINRRPTTSRKPPQTKPRPSSSAKPTRRPVDTDANEAVKPILLNVTTTGSGAVATTHRRPTPTPATTINNDELLTTVQETKVPQPAESVAQTTHAPRPRPQPTAEIVKVPKPSAGAEPTTATPTSTTSTTTTAAPTTTRATTKRPSSTTTRTKPTTPSTTTTTTARTTTTQKATTLKPTTSKPHRTTTTATTTTTTTTKAPISSTTPKSPTLTTESPKVEPPMVELTTTTPGLITWTNVDNEPTTINATFEWGPPPTALTPDISNKTADAPVTTNATVFTTSSPPITSTMISVSTSISEIMSNITSIMPKPERPSSVMSTRPPKPKPTKTTERPAPGTTTTPSSTSTSTTTTTTTTAKPKPKPTIPSTTSTSTTTTTTTTTESPIELVEETASSTTSAEQSTEGFSTTGSGIFGTTDYSTEDFNGTLSSSTSAPVNSLEGMDYRQICGRRMFPEPRIVGGSNAAFGRWPWQISLRQWRTSTYLHKCGAALLNENWAITAAHCVENVPPSDLLLRMGEYDLAEEEEPYGYQERRVQIVASHPQFDARTFEYDLALLRFYEPVVFQPNIIPVCVPNSDIDFVGQTAFVTGWGRLYENGPLPSVLQEVAVPVINNTICESMYRVAGFIEHIPHIFICAGWKKGGYDSCEGDSGGPMVLQREDDKRFQLGGVISWGIGCAEANQPGVYTRISEFRDWINQILQF
uniref:Serine proteinase stubble n=1 Tax=Bactrocera dorsalis TaxID=27457 RepID=A0A034V6Z5_BACDO